jgi:hypothetical protein
MDIHIGHSFFASGNFGSDLVLAGFLVWLGLGAPVLQPLDSSKPPAPRPRRP